MYRTVHVGRSVRDQVVHPDGTSIERFFRWNWKGELESRVDRLAGEDFRTDYGRTFGGAPTWVQYPSGERADWAFGPGGALSRVKAGSRDVYTDLRYSPEGGMRQSTLAQTGNLVWRQVLNARDWPRAVWVVAAGTSTVDRAFSSSRS